MPEFKKNVKINAIVEFGLDGKVSWANDNFLNLTEKKLEEVVNKNVSDFFIHPSAKIHKKSPIEILVVDDDADHRTLVSFFLDKLPYRVEFAENGEIGLSKFMENKYDLVLMDIQMPTMNGYEATQAMRGWETVKSKARTPIVALSSLNPQEGRIEFQKAGFDLYLRKPISKHSLINVINTVVEKNFAVLEVMMAQQK